MRTQMVPVATITDSLQRAVRDLARSQGKDIRWDARGTDTELDRGVLHQLSDSLLHLVRNAVDHGIESPAERRGRRQASARHDPAARDAARVGGDHRDHRRRPRRRLRPGARAGVPARRRDRRAQRRGRHRSSPCAPASRPAFVTDCPGRGVGLDVVRANVEAARGRIEVRSQPGVGSEFRIVVPITLAVLRCLLVEAGGSRFALPFHRVVRSQADGPSNKTHAEGRAAVWVDKRAVQVSVLSQILGGPSDSDPGRADRRARGHRAPARLQDRPAARPARRRAQGAQPAAPHRAGRCRGQRRAGRVGAPRSRPSRSDPTGPAERLDPRTRRRRQPCPSAQARRLLVVDDALTVRELQRSILERADFSGARRDRRQPRPCCCWPRSRVTSCSPTSRCRTWTASRSPRRSGRMPTWPTFPC